MNVFLLSEIFRPEPGRVRPYPDASHPRSGERGRIIRRQNPLSILFQKKFFAPLFSRFPEHFPHFHPPSPPPAQKFFSPRRTLFPPSMPERGLPSSRKTCKGAIPVLSIISIFSTFSIKSSPPCAHFWPPVRSAPLPPLSRPRSAPLPQKFPHFLGNLAPLETLETLEIPRKNPDSTSPPSPS